MERVAKLEAVINEGLLAFEKIHRLHSEGRVHDARQRLGQLLDVLIDKRLRPLIEEAVATESKSCWPNSTPPSSFTVCA